MKDEFRITEYDQAMKLIDVLREQVDAGEVLSVLFISERTDGTLWGGCTATTNTFTVAGAMFSWGLRRIGFQVKEPSQEESKGDD